MLFLAASFFSVQAETISSAKTTIVYPVNGTFNELLAAKEVRRYVYLRSGQLLDATPVASLPASGGLFEKSDVGLAARGCRATCHALMLRPLQTR